MTEVDKALQVFTQAEDSALSKLCTRIESGRLTLAPTRTVLSPVITQLRAQYSESLDRMIRVNRLRETARLKAVLQQKLTHVEQQIDFLNEFDDPVSKKTVSTFYRADRRAFYREEEKKTKETAEFAKRLAEEQLERRLKRRQEAKELMAAARSAQQAAQTSLQTRKAEALTQLKEAERTKFEQLAEERKAYMQSIAQLPTRHKTKMPASHTQPRRAKPVKPESWVEVRQHMDKYDEVKRSKGESESLDTGILRNQPSPTHKYSYNRLLNVLKEEENEEEAVQARERAERAKRLELKKRYGVIIKEMYAPTVDPDLRQQVETRSHMFAKGSKSLQSLRDMRTERPKPKLDHIYPRIRAKESEERLPEQESKRKPQDYLVTLRKRKAEEQGTVLKQLLAAGKQPEDLEHREKLVKRLDVLNSQGLSALESVSTDLLASVKAKLAQVQSSPKPN